MNEEVSAFWAQLDVPNREPVMDEPLIIEAVRDVATLSELKAVSDPDKAIFFQLGKITSFLGMFVYHISLLWLVQYCPLPFRANNINNKYVKKYYYCESSSIF